MKKKVFTADKWLKILKRCAFNFASIICVCLRVAAQNDYRTPVIEPTPISKAFARFGNEKPSLAYGSVNIPIHLFDIKSFGINIPVTLSYQTSGINVSDTPYPAGYGWIFSPNFRISRKIIGRPDDFYTFNQLNGGEDYETLKRGIISDDYNLNTHSLSPTDLYDSQKDVFTLSLPSGNYNFLIRWTGNYYEIVSIGNKLKIESIALPIGISGSAPSIISGFKVIDENGIVYMFGDNNGNIGNFAEGEGYSWCTSWVLREMILLNGEKIKFTWQKANTSAYAQSTNTPVEVIDYLNNSCGPFTFGVSDVGGMISYASIGMVNTLLLKRIEFSGNSVEMTYKSLTDPFLQSVVLKDSNGAIIKDIGLIFGTSNISSDNTLLQSVRLGDEIYRFQYNTNRFGPSTTALDYWGFYNGKTNNGSLIPKMKLKLRAYLTSLVDLDIDAGYGDRSVSASHMQAFMLTRITYPTGGFSDYEYEPHQFTGQLIQSNDLFSVAPDPLTIGGGLRVKAIKSYASVGATPVVKTYKYGIGEDGLANISLAPTLDTFIDEYVYQYQYPSCLDLYTTVWPLHRLMKINAISNYNKYMINRPPIWYSEVTEYINDELKTSTTFEYNEAYNVSYEKMYWAVKFPWLFRYENIFTSGPRPKMTLVCKKNGTSYVPLRRVENEYKRVHRSQDDQPSALIDRKAIYSTLNSPGIDFFPQSYYRVYQNLTDVNFVALPYTLSVVYNYLSKTITTDYESGGIVSTEEVNTYEGEYLSQTSRVTSETAGIKIDYKYTKDFSDQVNVSMFSKNIVAPVIETTTYRGSILIQKVKTNYTNVPKGTSSLFLPNSIETIFYPSTSATTNVSFEKYDNKGNILQKSYLGGVKTSYLWSYNYKYPIAEILNSDYPSVVSSLGGQILVDSLCSGYPSDQQVSNFLAPLKLALPNAQITTYTYKPLVGMTSMTDAKGMTTYYEYDGFQRLRLVRDHRQNIVKTYCYGYAGQPISCEEVAKTYRSAARSQAFTRNNCPSGQTGSSVTYTVPEGTYSASSQSAADALAAADIAANGQNYANAQGQCLGTFNLGYSVPGGRSFLLELRNVYTGQYYYYFISGNSSNTITGLPQGTYWVSVNESSYQGRYTFYLGGKSLTGTRVGFPEMAFSSYQFLYIMQN